MASVNDPREREVRLALQDMEGGIDRLEQAIAHLIEELSPVLRPEDEGAGVGPENKFVCPLAHQLRNFTDRIAFVVWQINKTIDRVEV